MTCADWITVILREWGISRHTHRGMLHTLIDSCLDRTLNGTQRWGVLGIALDSQRNTHHPMERTGSRANLSRARALVQCPKSCVHLSKLMRARGRVKVDFLFCYFTIVGAVLLFLSLFAWYVSMVRLSVCTSQSNTQCKLRRVRKGSVATSDRNSGRTKKNRHDDSKVRLLW